MTLDARGAFPRLWRCAGVSGGAPCLRTTGILVSIIAHRFAAGDSINLLADDYGVPTQSIVDALRLVITVNGSCLNSHRAQARIAAVVPETVRPPEVTR